MNNSTEGRPKISIVIPAYNEEQRIKTVIKNYCGFFHDFELVVVCDGIDSTNKIVRELMISCPQIKLLEFSNRLGKGQAIKEGLKKAIADKVGFVDADESVEASDVKKMFDALSYADGVIASRRLKESKILIKQPLKRRISSGIFNIFVRILFGLNFKDTQCGAKVFRRNAIEECLFELNTKGFEFDVELLWRLKKRGLNIIEFPITWKHSEGSSFGLSNAPKMFFSLLKVRIWN